MKKPTRICIKKLQDMTLLKLTAYFNKSWHGIRKEWVNGMKNANMNMGNRTTNRVECINKQIQSVIVKYSPMPVFWRDLKLAMSALETERKDRALLVFDKSAV